VREKYCSLAEKVRLISQANRAFVLACLAILYMLNTLFPLLAPDAGMLLFNSTTMFLMRHSSSIQIKYVPQIGWSACTQCFRNVGSELLELT